jgi:glycosyltransferase involved in cell wall biosynthesis
MPKVSIILPNYNHQEYIQQRIESILNQDFRDFELIILDDASNDNSTQFIKKYLDDERVKEFLINDENSGSPFIQWERGLHLAKSEYIWIAESDDIAKPNFLSETLKILENDPKVGLAFCSSVWIDKKGLEIHSPGHEEDDDRWQGKNLVQNEFLVGNVIYNASSAVFRKDLVRKINFSQLVQFKYTGDWLFWVQLISDTNVVRLGKRLNFFRRHPDNVSFKSDRQGLQFIEGIKIALYIFKNYPIGFWKRRTTMLYWSRKILLSKVDNVKDVLKKMPYEVNIYFRILNLFK